MNKEQLLNLRRNLIGATKEIDKILIKHFYCNKCDNYFELPKNFKIGDNVHCPRFHKHLIVEDKILTKQ